MKKVPYGSGAAPGYPSAPQRSHPTPDRDYSLLHGVNKRCRILIYSLTAVPVIIFILCVLASISLQDPGLLWIVTSGLGAAVLFMCATHIMSWHPRTETIVAASLGLAIPVELIDSSGDRHYTIARRVNDKLMEASISWNFDIGHVLLRSDGTVDPSSRSVYVLFWLPLRRQDRMMHLLANNLPDFSGLEDRSKVERRNIMRDWAKQHNLGSWAI